MRKKEREREREREIEREREYVACVVESYGERGLFGRGWERQPRGGLNAFVWWKPMEEVYLEPSGSRDGDLSCFFFCVLLFVHLFGFCVLGTT